MKKIDDLRILGSKSLISPLDLKKEFPMTNKSSQIVIESRNIIGNIIKGEDKRLLAIVGPCSIHDPAAAIEYSEKLNNIRKRIEDRIYIVMRVYFEKPRTTIGWRGIITDPHLDGSYDIAYGLRTARKILLDITSTGLPAGTEMLDPIVPQYISDLISWTAVGARTAESQIHRNLASGLSMSVGFKNTTDGNFDTAVNALEAAKHTHSFIGIDQNGQTCVLKTKGNDSVHIILRGGRQGPNYHEENVEKAETLMRKSDINPVVVIDCSHSNSGKNPKRQKRVLHSILDQKIHKRDSIIGFMIESNLYEGQQIIPENLDLLKYGVSITDSCAGWDETEKMLLYAYDVMEGC